MKYIWKYICITILLSFGLTTLNISANSANFATSTAINGENLGDISIRWWQWVTNAPDEQDPLGDDTGEHCNYGQSGDVFFLAPSYSFDKVVRNCIIPKNKYIFFPVISMMRWDTGDGLSCEDLKKEVKTAINSAQDMLVELNGQKIQVNRAATINCFNIPGDDDHYASDGYWVLLNPLSEGNHQLHFKGQIDYNDAMEEEYMQDIEYKIIVR